MNNLTSKLINLLEHSMPRTQQGSFLSTPLVLNLSLLSHPLAQESSTQFYYMLYLLPLSQASNHKMSQVSNPTCTTTKFQLLKLFNTLGIHILGIKKRKELGENWSAGRTGMQLKENQSWNGLMGGTLWMRVCKYYVYVHLRVRLGEITKLYWQWLDKDSKKRTKNVISILSKYHITPIFKWWVHFALTFII